MTTFVNGIKQTPKVVKDGEDLDWASFKNNCGYHSYFPRNQTLIWIMNANDNCEVEVRILNTLKAALVFDIDVIDFYKDIGESKFIDRLADRLGVKPW